MNGVPLRRVAHPGDRHDTGDVLESARALRPLDEAIADCVLVAAFTARHRAARWAITTPREVPPTPARRHRMGPVALMFGREDKGLPNEALDRAHVHVTIPTTGYASLNLAQAVMVALYTNCTSRPGTPRAPQAAAKDARPRKAAELERFHADAEAALRDRFLQDPLSRTRHARSPVTHRAADPNAREISLMRAMAIEVVKNSSE